MIPHGPDSTQSPGISPELFRRVLNAFDDLDLYEKCTSIIAEGRAALDAIESVK